MGRSPSAPDAEERSPRDFRTRDFATADAEPATLGASPEDYDPLPNRDYTSVLFWRFARALDPQAPPRRILDLGPTVDENIRFWADRGFRVTCLPILEREARALRDTAIEPPTLSRDRLAERSLPYPDESFSAVCAWNVFATLPFVLGRRYLQECYRVLHPSGLIHAIALDAPGRLDARREYRVADRQQLAVSSRRQPRTASREMVDAELELLFSRFDAIDIRAAPCQTRELIAQKAPTNNFPGGDGGR